MTTGKMEVRDPNIFDMMQQGSEGIGNQIRAIFAKYHSQIKIFETEINMEAPNADAEIIVSYTNTFTGAARNVDTVTAEADVAGSLNNKYFWFYIATTQHYVWFNVNAGGADPSVAGTAHEVAFATGANAATVGAAIVAVIDAIASISASGTTNMLIEVDAVGVVTAAVYDGNSGFTFVNNIAGTAAYTANYFYAVSNNVKDDAAGVGTRTIRVFIIDADGRPNSTDIIMDGTTNVKSSVKAKGIYGMIGLTAGSEGDTAGTLILLDTGANEVYCTIAAAGMSSVSARCLVPDEWNCVLGDIRSHILEVSDAAVDIDQELGAILSPLIKEESSDVDDDLLDRLIVTHFNNVYRNDIHDICDGGDGTYYTLNHETKADDKNTTLYTKIRYILFGDA
jgi:hypothetical protein